MKMSLPYFLVFYVLLFLSINLAWAETRYISDQLIVSLRLEPNNQSEVLTYLRTDTKVEVIGENGDYFKVKTRDNNVGYIQKTYLLKDTPKSFVIKQLSAENESLKKRIDSLDNQLEATSSKDNIEQTKLSGALAEEKQLAKQFQKELEVTKSRLNKINTDYETLKKDASDVIEIKKERDQLQSMVTTLSTKIAEIEEDKYSLQKSQAIRWFLAGAGVLIVGWLIGRTASSRRRKSLY